jgi:ribosome-binding ATPase YchF (GTP1/OBG family)
LKSELILSDLVVVEKRMERLEKERKKIKSTEHDREFALLERCKATLEQNVALRTLELDTDEEKLIRGFQFLSQKPMLFVLNIGEEDAARMRHEIEEKYRKRSVSRAHEHRRHRHLRQDRSRTGRAFAGEAREYLTSYGLKDSGLTRLISATYALLGLMSFLTAGETEVRAWTVPMNSPAQKAAGAIHSDFEKKFIRAEVVNWQALMDHQGYPGVREKGLLRLEGKEYIVKDGDVLVIRHG